MKTSNRQRLARLATIALVAGGAFTACSDWDDHYADNSQVSPTGTMTIWEVLESREDLSQFRNFVAKAQMDTILNKVNAYTVWAPLNGTFNADSVEALTDKKLLEEFIYNHIALYNHNSSSAIKERVMLLSEKQEYFVGVPGNYTMAELPVKEAGISCKNGYLHTIEGNIMYYPNIYEMIKEGMPGIDSLRNYILSYDVRTLDLSQSTEGPTVNGERTYLDSVYVEYNRFINSRRAYINREDSSYTLLMPTNEAWESAKAAIAKDFNYISSFSYLDKSTSDTERSDNTKKTDQIDAAYLTDSIAKELLSGCLLFNNNLYNNGALKTLETGESLEVDSLVGMFGLKLFTDDARELMSGVTRYTASNGNMFVTDSLRVHPWEAWNPLIRIEAENAQISYEDRVASMAVEYVSPERMNPSISGKISRNGFLNVTGATNRYPKIDFYLPGLLSTEYNIYVVVVPENVNDIYDTIPRYNKLQFAIGNNDLNGSLKSWGFEDYGKATAVKGKLSEWIGEEVITDPTKIDTVYVGTIDFPIAYRYYSGSGTFNPFLRVEDCAGKRNNKMTNNFRLDCVLLVPTELDNYMKEHPDYKYGTYTFKEERFTSSR